MIGNTNARRALYWLAHHPEHATPERYNALVWMPATAEAARVAA